MMRLMNQLSDKPDWHQKVFDAEIKARWRQEALAMQGVDVTEKMVDWVQLRSRRVSVRIAVM